MPIMSAAALRRFVRPFDDLDASALAAATGVNLCLDDDRAAAELLGHDIRVGGGKYDFSLRHRDAVARQDRLCLILVDFHA